MYLLLSKDYVFEKAGNKNVQGNPFLRILRCLMVHNFYYCCQLTFIEFPQIIFDYKYYPDLEMYQFTFKTVCACMFTYTHMHIQTYICIYVYMCIYMYICIYINKRERYKRCWALKYLFYHISMHTQTKEKKILQSQKYLILYLSIYHVAIYREKEKPRTSLI